MRQSMKPGSELFLTGASLEQPLTSGRSVLFASSNGCSAALCSLFGTGAQALARLEQPFSDEVSFSAHGKAAIHLNGYTRGDMGPAEVIEGTVAGQAEQPTPAGTKASSQKESSTKQAAVKGSIAARSKSVASDDLMGVQDEEESEDEDDEDEESEEGEEGEEGEDGEEDEESEEESEEERQKEEAPPPSKKAKMSAADASSKPAAKEPAKQPAKVDAKHDKATEKSAASNAAASAVSATAISAAQLAASTKGHKEAEPNPFFIASKTFTGRKVGYIFHKGVRGVGYYRDDKKPQPKAAAAKTAQRAPEGMKRMPNGLEIQEMREGRGAVAQIRSKVKVKYAGTLTNGKRFDAGSIDFRLGAGEVIKGWDLGVVGMRVGGQRKLRIPPQLGYGKRGAPPTIPGNATLCFDVELLKC